MAMVVVDPHLSSAVYCKELQNMCVEITATFECIVTGQHLLLCGDHGGFGVHNAYCLVLQGCSDSNKSFIKTVSMYLFMLHVVD